MSIKENYLKIMENIEGACERSRRNLSDITLVGVSKTQPSEIVREAYEAGVTIFGENRTQEAEQHQADLADLNIDWHFIGKLQKNKINRILGSFDFIQSVDGVKTLEHIHKRCSDPIEVFIEINIGDEKTKSGFTIASLDKATEYMAALDRVKVTGLMCIPPFSEDPDDTRPYFVSMRDLKDDLNSRGLPNFDIKHLSMGMSGDYEVAIEEGATMVRLGTALFGRRR